MQLAQDELGYPAHDQVRSKFLEALDHEIGKWPEGPKLRTAIGVAAKKGGWFKDTTRGELWFKAISPAFQEATFVQKNLALELGKLLAWAEHV